VFFIDFSCKLFLFLHAMMNFIKKIGKFSSLRAGIIGTILATGMLFSQLEYEESWAVVIGINDYENDQITDLNYAISDAVDIKKMLVEYYGFPEENITSL